MSDTQGRDPAAESNPDLGRLSCRATELASELADSYMTGDVPAQVEDTANAVAGVLAFEPAHQQPALAAKLAAKLAALGVASAADAVAEELSAALTTTSRELPAALAMVRSGASLLIGYKPSDLVVAALRDVTPDGAQAADDGELWATYRPGTRRMVVSLKGDPHLDANTGRTMRAADPAPTP